MRITFAGSIRSVRFSDHAEVRVRLQPLEVVHPVGERGPLATAGRSGGSSSSPTRRGGGAASARRCAARPRWAGRRSRRAPRARARLGSVSMASAWSEWAAITTSSKSSVSQPSAAISTSVVVPGDRAHRRVQADAVGERPRDLLHVAARAAGHRAPLRPVAEAEHAVVVEEAGEEAGRERPHLLRLGRPDRGGLGHDQPLARTSPSSRPRRGTRAATGPAPGASVEQLAAPRG